MWESTADVAAWFVGISLMLAGVIGTAVPVLPGTFLILLGAVAFALIGGFAESGIGWVGFAVLALLFGLSVAVDMVSGALGAKWFGATRWGAIGAIVGGLIGLFFSIPGILIGPLVGAFAFEMFFAKKEWKPAGKSGMGTLIGGAAGLVLKLGIAALMITWFFLDVFVFKGI